ncbi:MAG: hypothetical protein GY950_05585, partial [bacterium]|nr:hypothetical protein [bacterium]
IKIKIKEYKKGKEKEILKKNNLLDEDGNKASFERKVRYLLLQGKDDYFKDEELLPRDYEYNKPPEKKKKRPVGGGNRKQVKEDNEKNIWNYPCLDSRENLCPLQS